MVPAVRKDDCEGLQRNEVMVRFATNVLLTGLAVALLGILVLLSTTADEGIRRQADLNLRQLRDIAAAIEREALSARNLQTDNETQLQTLGAELHARVEAIGHDLSELFPTDEGTLASMRTVAEAGFNSIDARSPGARRIGTACCAGSRN